MPTTFCAYPIKSSQIIYKHIRHQSIYIWFANIISQYIYIVLLNSVWSTLHSAQDNRTYFIYHHSFQSYGHMCYIEFAVSVIFSDSNIKYTNGRYSMEVFYYMYRIIVIYYEVDLLHYTGIRTSRKRLSVVSVLLGSPEFLAQF